MARNRVDYVRNEIYEPFSRRAKANAARTRTKVIERMYTRVLSEMCMNRFAWEGMPPEIDTRYLEYTLYLQGLAVFFYDDDYGRFFCLKGSGAGPVNMYDNPTSFVVTGNAQYNNTVAGNNCVPIYANYCRESSTDIVAIYAQRLAEIDRTIEINMLNARNTVLVAVDDSERMTMKEAFSAIVEGQPVIWGTEGFNASAVKDKLSVINLNENSNSSLTDILTVKLKVWNEAMTLLGIMNVNSEKAERMVVEEASGSSGQVMAMRAVELNCRRKAADMINDKYGLSITVGWNLDQEIAKGVPGLDGADMAMGEGVF